MGGAVPAPAGEAVRGGERAGDAGGSLLAQLQGEQGRSVGGKCDLCRLLHRRAIPRGGYQLDTGE